MSILTQYRERLHIKEVKKGKNKHKGNFTGFNNTCILLETTNADILQESMLFIKQFKEKATKLTILGFMAAKELPETLPFDGFSNKDLDWIWRPKEHVMDRFKSNSFDLLINLCQTDCFPLEYLAVSANANYKIGALTDYPNNYDLMLDSKGLSKYLEQVDFFLSKFSD